MNVILTVLYSSLLFIYGLWLFYLAIMNLQRAYKNNTLTKPVLFLGYPIVIVGFVLDVLINLFVFSVLFLELPKELTVSSRLHRHNTNTEDSWRKTFAAYFEPILNPFDPTGKHI